MEFTGHTKLNGSNSLPNALIKPVFGVKKGGSPFDTITSGLNNAIQAVGDNTKDVGSTIQGHFNRFLNNTMFTSEKKNDLPSVPIDIAPPSIQTSNNSSLPVDTNILNDNSKASINTPSSLNTVVNPVGGRITKKNKKTRKYRVRAQHRKGRKHHGRTIKRKKIHKRKNAHKKH